MREAWTSSSAPIICSTLFRKDGMRTGSRSCRGFGITTDMATQHLLIHGWSDPQAQASHRIRFPLVSGEEIMSDYHCCEAAASVSSPEAPAARTTDREPHPPTFLRRCLYTAEWTVPGVILLFLPKCPACLAAYVAIGTGVGLSISSATYLRTALLTLCVTAISYLAAKFLRRFTFQIWAWRRYRTQRHQ
jgi:hypothetical protein